MSEYKPLADYRKLAHEAKATAAKAEPVRVTAQTLHNAGFNPFAAKLLSESFAAHPAKDDLMARGVCIAYGDVEITLGLNACRASIGSLADAVLELCRRVELGAADDR